MDSFRDTLYTIDKSGKRKWVYPTLARGARWSQRVVVSALLLVIYLSMPWLTFAGEQAVFLDIFGRRFVFFGQIFFATDTIFLTLILAILGFSLFFFSAVFGRVWCGWACPETVFLEFVFRPLERIIEGKEAARRRLDQGPWTTEKILRKSLKLIVFSGISWVLASTALAYFVGRVPLLTMIAGSPFDHLGLFLLTLALMGVMLFQFGWFREQFCTVLCPYARFQSVLLDPHSIIVGYDKLRGEPRGKATKDAAVKHGDCIDCGLCVRVCPTGIDIRNGMQLECIHCTQCADACDSIMTSIGKPRGLVRYDTEAGFEGKKRHWLRPRVVIYAVLLLIAASALVFKLSTREYSEFRVVRAQHDSPFQVLPDGYIVNHFEVQISNKSRIDKALTFSTSDAGSTVRVVQPITPFPAPGNSIVRMPLFLHLAPELFASGTVKVEVVARDAEHEIGRQVVTVIGPAR